MKSQINYYKIHRSLRVKLAKDNMSQDKLANKLGIGRGTINRILNEKEVKFSTFLKIIDWLGGEINEYVIKVKE